MVSNLSPFWLLLLHTLKELEWFQKLHLLFSESLPKYVLTSKYVWNENKHHAYQSAYRHLCLEVAQTLSFSFQSTHPACQHVLLSYFISILNQSISNNNIKKLQTVCPPVQTILHPHQSKDSVNIRHLVIFFKAPHVTARRLILESCISLVRTIAKQEIIHHGVMGSLSTETPNPKGPNPKGPNPKGPNPN